MQSLVHFAPVFPMYVGVILVYAYPCLASLCIPHVCGGDPTAICLLYEVLVYSPCMWG